MTVQARARSRWLKCHFGSVWKSARCPAFWNTPSPSRGDPKRAGMRAASGVFACALAFPLQAAAPKQFKIIEAGIHQSEDGALAPAGTTFVPGEVLFFS